MCGNQDEALIYVADAKTNSPLKMLVLDLIHSLLLQGLIAIPFGFFSSTCNM